MFLTFVWWMEFQSFVMGQIRSIEHSWYFPLPWDTLPGFFLPLCFFLFLTGFFSSNIRCCHASWYDPYTSLKQLALCPLTTSTFVFPPFCPDHRHSPLGCLLGLCWSCLDNTKPLRALQKSLPSWLSQQMAIAFFQMFRPENLDIIPSSSLLLTSTSDRSGKSCWPIQNRCRNWLSSPLSYFYPTTITSLCGHRGPPPCTPAHNTQMLRNKCAQRASNGFLAIQKNKQHTNREACTTPGSSFLSLPLSSLPSALPGWPSCHSCLYIFALAPLSQMFFPQHGPLSPALDVQCGIT